MTARLDVLCAGYAADRVASTVVLIRDEGAVIVVDPGMVADRRRILDPLARLGVDITNPDFWSLGLRLLDDMVGDAERLAEKL